MLRLFTGGRALHKLTIARWLTGCVWFLSWFELYLEVFRYRHVALIARTAPAFVGALNGAHAGGWLRAVVACAWLAPFAFVVLAVSGSLRRRHSLTSRGILPHHSFSCPVAAIAFGGALTLLGVINQAVRRPPLELDLTLRQGNGGFIVLGAALAILGFLWRHAVAGR